MLPEEKSIQDKASSQANSSTLLQFLMSSLNIELVHIILFAVSERTVGTAKHEEDYRVYQDYDHTNENTFVVDSIEIPDKETWDVAAVFDGDSGRDRASTLSRRPTAQSLEFTNTLVINEDI